MSSAMTENRCIRQLLERVVLAQRRFFDGRNMPGQAEECFHASAAVQKKPHPMISQEPLKQALPSKKDPPSLNFPRKLPHTIPLPSYRYGTLLANKQTRNKQNTRHACTHKPPPPEPTPP